MTSPPIIQLSLHLNSGASPNDDHRPQILSLSLVFSSCDSRNLNLSPFCNTSATSLVMWKPSMEATYGNATASYVTGIQGPMRPKYPRAMAEKELISSLTEVLLLSRMLFLNFGHREIRCTMLMRRTLHWSTSILEDQQCLVTRHLLARVFLIGELYFHF